MGETIWPRCDDPVDGSPSHPSRFEVAPRMGVRRWRRYDGGVRRYFTRRCVGMHVTLLILLPTFAFLTKWQLDRALGGNTLSWAYTFEWPLFALYALYVWWQLIHDQPTPGLRGSSASSRVSSSVGTVPGAVDPADRTTISPAGPSPVVGRRTWPWRPARSSMPRPVAGASGTRPRRRRRRRRWPIQPLPGRAQRSRRRLLPSMTGPSPEARRLGRPSLSRLFDRGMEGALIRYRVMTFIVGSALIVLVFLGVPLQVWGTLRPGGQSGGHHPRLPLPGVPVFGGRRGPAGPLADRPDPGRGPVRLRALSGLHRRAPGVPADAGGVGGRRFGDRGRSGRSADEVTGTVGEQS